SDADEARAHADGEIKAGGDNNHRLPAGHDAKHRGLTADIAHVDLTVEIRIEQREDDHHRHDDGDQPDVRPCRMAGPLGQATSPALQRPLYRSAALLTHRAAARRCTDGFTTEP